MQASPIDGARSLGFLGDARVLPLPLPVAGTVSLLTDFEQAAHLDDWEIGVHGVRIDFTDFRNQPRSAVYLPDVIPEQGWSPSRSAFAEPLKCFLLRQDGQKRRRLSLWLKNLDAPRGSRLSYETGYP